MSETDDVLLFAFGTTREFGERVASNLGIDLSPIEERPFEDGEHKTRSLTSVRERDVYVIQSLYSDREQSVNDKLIRLLFFLGSLRDASAGRVTAVIPYLAYARKDRKSKSRDPVTSRYVAQLFEAVGTDRVVTIDVHNLTAFQNAFRIRTEHLEANNLFVEHVAQRFAVEQRIAIIAPDAGGVKRAQAFRDRLIEATGQDIALVMMEKTRSAGVLSAGDLYGDVSDRLAIIIDDMISTGRTLALAARAAKSLGAREVHAVATHGVFVEGANHILAAGDLNGVITTDTVPPFRLDPELVRQQLTQISVTGLVAEAIRRLGSGGSIVELLEG